MEGEQLSGALGTRLTEAWHPARRALGRARGGAPAPGARPRLLGPAAAQAAGAQRIFGRLSRPYFASGWATLRESHESAGPTALLREASAAGFRGPAGPAYRGQSLSSRPSPGPASSGRPRPGRLSEAMAAGGRTWHWLMLNQEPVTPRPPAGPGRREGGSEAAPGPRRAGVCTCVCPRWARDAPGACGAGGHACPWAGGPVRRAPAFPQVRPRDAAGRKRPAARGRGRSGAGRRPAGAGGAPGPPH